MELRERITQKLLNTHFLTLVGRSDVKLWLLHGVLALRLIIMLRITPFSEDDLEISSEKEAEILSFWLASEEEKWKSRDLLGDKEISVTHTSWDYYF